MTFPITAALAGGCLLLTLLFGWQGARPPKPGRVRLAPWRFMMVLAFTATIAFAVHLVTLARESAGQDSAPGAPFGP